MISTISPKAYVAPQAPTPPPARTNPAPQQTPPEGDKIDLSSVVDTAQKAAQLPILDTGLQMGIASAVAVAILSGMGGATAATSIQVDYQSQVADNTQNLQYQFDLGAVGQGAQPIQVSGDINGKPVQGGLNLDEQAQALKWQANLGGVTEAYQFGPSASNEKVDGLVLQGKLGNVDADLRFSVLGDLDNPSMETINGYQVKGTLDGYDYNATTTYQLSEEMSKAVRPEPGQTINIGTVSTVGNLGELGINRQYTITGQLTPEGGFVATAVGGGQNAGLDSKSTTTLRVSQ